MSIEMDGAAERQRRERAMVWYGAMLPYLKEPPSFDKFVNPDARPARAKRQTPVEQTAMLAALAAAWGAKQVH